MEKQQCQYGFSLLEVLIALLLYSVSLLGLLQYHQVLLQAFHRHWQAREAWSLAHQNLDIFSVRGSFNETAKPGWKQYIRVSTRGECQQVSALVITPHNLRAELSRWLCH